VPDQRSSEKKEALSVEQRADLVALTDHYMKLSEEKTTEIESVLTILGGKVVYARDEFASHAPSTLPSSLNGPIKVFGDYGVPLDMKKKLTEYFNGANETLEAHHRHPRKHQAVSGPNASRLSS
jgi:hypothetical protein